MNFSVEDFFAKLAAECNFPIYQRSYEPLDLPSHHLYADLDELNLRVIHAWSRRIDAIKSRNSHDKVCVRITLQDGGYFVLYWVEPRYIKASKF